MTDDPRFTPGYWTAKRVEELLANDWQGVLILQAIVNGRVPTRSNRGGHRWDGPPPKTAPVDGPAKPTTGRDAARHDAAAIDRHP